MRDYLGLSRWPHDTTSVISDRQGACTLREGGGHTTTEAEMEGYDFGLRMLAMSGAGEARVAPSQGSQGS
jgi:hypothetical protein